MGKTNDKMRKSRAGIKTSDFGISPVESQGKLTQDLYDMEAQEYVVEHEHEWHFVKEIKDWGTIRDYPVVTSKFACLCGAVKRVKQFEVEE